MKEDLIQQCEADSYPSAFTMESLKKLQKEVSSIPKMPDLTIELADGRFVGVSLPESTDYKALGFQRGSVAMSPPTAIRLQGKFGLGADARFGVITYKLSDLQRVELLRKVVVLLYEKPA